MTGYTGTDAHQDIGYNRRNLDATTKLERKKVLLLDEDSKFCKQIRRLGRKQGLNVMLCFNFGDFWTMLSENRDELLAVVADYKFTNQMIKSSQFHRVGRTPILITSSKSKSESAIADLPFYNSAFIHKKYGASVLVDSVVAFREPQSEPALVVN